MQPSRSLHLAAIRQARQVLQVQLDRRGGTGSTSSRRWSKRRRRPWSISRWVIVLHFGTAVNFALPCMPQLCLFKPQISPGSPPKVAFLAQYADRTNVGWHVFCFLSNTFYLREEKHLERAGIEPWSSCTACNGSYLSAIGTRTCSF